jgi:hypothetical protein
MEFWLILSLASGSSPLHVGTFSSMANCEAAGKAAIVISPTPAPLPHNFICAQTREAGAAPPPAIRQPPAR